MENLQSETPYNFKKSYGGTPEPLPPEYPPFRRGLSLKLAESIKASVLQLGGRSKFSSSTRTWGGTAFTGDDKITK
jgi:hypothetical protein